MVAKCILWWLLAVISVALPWTGFLWVRRRVGVSLKPAWHGAAVQILFGTIVGSLVVALMQTNQSTLTKLLEHPVGGAFLFGLWEVLALTVGCVVWMRFVLKDTSVWGSVVLGMGMGTWSMVIAGLVSGVAYGCHSILVISGGASSALSEVLSTGAAYSVGMILLQMLRLIAWYVRLAALCVAIWVVLYRRGKTIFAYGAWLCGAACFVLDDLITWADTRIIPLQALLAAGMVALILATGIFAQTKTAPGGTLSD